MDQNNIIESGGFYFIHNFDSGNLGHVERVPTELIAPSLNTRTNAPETPDYEFNLWTRPDCAGTEFENGNRTWFYFGIQASEPGVVVRLNLINLNKQGKMYNQGMAPVTRTLPGKPQWERIRDRPVHSTDDNTFTLSFKYRTSENLKATTFFAFTYPFSFAELQISLNSIDLKMLPLPPPQTLDDIYYHRECLVYSLEGRRVDLLTITSHHGVTQEREERLKNLFPENQERPYKFSNKKVVFISARVHPGETPSSFVFNGFLNLLLTRNDPIAIQLRKLYVFKMIPFLNPDGVARGHYRTDTRGVNLNRVYLNPSLVYHPTVYASRALIRYYHFGCEKEDNCDDSKSFGSRSIQNINESAELIDKKKKISTTSTVKNDISKREIKSGKSVSVAGSRYGVKSATMKKEKNLSTDTANLTESVYDIKLQEMTSQTSSPKPSPSVSNMNESNSLLNDGYLRTCLGSNVHLSNSEELNIQGSNPLRPLRDTLKNSISLLMESCSTVTGDSECVKEPHMKMGWCSSCRAAVCRLERTMPGITRLVPGYTADAVQHSRHESPTSIDEYRDIQRQKLDEQERKDIAASQKEENVFFCTNCFKRYLLSDKDEEIKVCESVSARSVSVSREAPPAAGTGDAGREHSPQHTEPTPPPKEDKLKPPAARAVRKKYIAPLPQPKQINKEPESGLYLYIDLHGHASKKGIFMYGNHFEDVESCVECMLLPRIMSLNNLHFHFSSCNFTERNMYLKDRRDGMSREGSGRVAVLKATGLVRSYTLECNYNTGRLVNVLPPPAHCPPAPAASAPPAQTAPAPPKYTPHIFEEVGRSLGASILDLTGSHPNSRIPCSEHRNLSAVRDWLRAHTRTLRPQLTMSRLRPKPGSPPRAPFARSKGKGTDERKENAYAPPRPDEHKRGPAAEAALDAKFAKRNEPVKSSSRTRYFADSEPKPKTLSTKRRNVLGLRKPNASKTQAGGGRGRAGRRSADDAASPRASTLSARAPRPAPSSSGLQAPPARRRPFPTPEPARLKKIRLKTAL